MMIIYGMGLKFHCFKFSIMHVFTNRTEKLHLLDKNPFIPCVIIYSLRFNTFKHINVMTPVLSTQIPAMVGRWMLFIQAAARCQN